MKFNVDKRKILHFGENRMEGRVLLKAQEEKDLRAINRIFFKSSKKSIAGRSKIKHSV